MTGIYTASVKNSRKKNINLIWKSQELVHSPPVKDPEIGSPVRFVLIRYSSQMIRDVQQPPLLHSNPVQEQHGIHIPLGQTLIVTSGCGWVQREGGSVEEIHPGDVVWFAPDEKHWHGATPTTAMTHIAIQENLNGKVVDWMEKVVTSSIKSDSISDSACFALRLTVSVGNLSPFISF